MLITGKNLERSDLHARDGTIGRVDDIYFEDRGWRIRYFVIDTGAWLPGRKVLISCAAVTTPAGLSVDLTREQVRNSPDIDTAKPVSRQHEEQLHRHYAWPSYWGGPYVGGDVDVPIAGPAAPTASAVHGSRRPMEGEAARAIGNAGPPGGAWREPEDDPHLRGMKAVRGYHVEATDGSVGHVEDLVIEDTSWEIHWLAVDTRNWLPGRKVLVSPRHAREIRWLDSSVFVNLTRDAVKSQPEYDSSAPFTADFTDRLEAHHRRIRDGTGERRPGGRAP